MTKDEKKSFDKIARLGCILCSAVLGYKDSPAELHHIIRFGGKRSLASLIPLCPEHLRGNTGVHGLGAKGFEKKWGVSQETLLERVEENLAQH